MAPPVLLADPFAVCCDLRGQDFHLEPHRGPFVKHESREPEWFRLDFLLSIPTQCSDHSLTAAQAWLLWRVPYGLPQPQQRRFRLGSLESGFLIKAAGLLEALEETLLFFIFVWGSHLAVLKGYYS